MEGEFASSTPVELRPDRWTAWLQRVRVSESAREKILYGAAAVSYVAIGVFVTEFVLSWVVGVAWLLLWVWGIPTFARQVRR